MLKKRLFKSAAGTSLFEMLLFAPLAMMFLFLVVDGGLALRERAAVTDALRAGVNLIPAISKQQPPFFISSALELELNPNALEYILDQATETIVNNINRSRGSNSSDNYQVKIEAYKVSIDINTGSVDSEIEPLLAVVFPHTAPASDLPQFDESPAEYIKQLISTGDGADGSSFLAIPAVSLYQGQNTISYLPQTILIYAEVVALTSGLNNSIISNLYNIVFKARERQVVLIKQQLK